ncbi:MAG: BspA family leucine-rich repeat surface protein [Candidatus Saccharibacteria bacterium]|nr:BspA family leucine-rich repeat surface protein [Candidatus Saccharibacteria bacterium]
MPKQKFCLGIKSTQNILFALASAALGLFVALVLFPIMIGNTRATGEQLNNGINISVDAPIEINLTPLANSMKIAKHTVTVDTGAASGYQLFIATDSVDHQTMYIDGDSSITHHTIESTTGTYAAPAALSLNTWGYAVAGLDNFDGSYNTSYPSTSSKFASVPLAGSEQLIHEHDGSISDDTTDVYFGVRAGSNLVAGDYSTEITYTALPSAIPRAAKAILGSNKTLTFVYDSNTYTVGDAYTNYRGSTTISAVYNVPLGNASARNDYNTLKWTAKSDIYYVDFDATFADFKLINVSMWFYYNRGLREIVNIENFNTSEVFSMERMFYGAGVEVGSGSTINLNLDKLQTGSVKKMYQMFYRVGRKSRTSDRVQVNFGDLSGWDVSKATDMSNMFEEAGYNSRTWDVGDIGKWNVGSVTSMANMFSNAGYYATSWKVGDIGKWNVGSVTSMASMFSDAGYTADSWSVGNLGKDANDPVNHPGWNLSNVTTMANMFKNAGRSATTDWSIGDISSWTTTKVTNMSYMFNGAGYSAANWDIGDIDNWTVSLVSNMNSMLLDAGFSATTWNIGDISGWTTKTGVAHTDFINTNLHNTNTITEPVWN